MTIEETCPTTMTHNPWWKGTTTITSMVNKVAHRDNTSMLSIIHSTHHWLSIAVTVSWCATFLKLYFCFNHSPSSLTVTVPIIGYCWIDHHGLVGCGREWFWYADPGSLASTLNSSGFPLYLHGGVPRSTKFMESQPHHQSGWVLWFANAV